MARDGLESNLAELGFKSLLKSLQIRGGWFVSLLFGTNAEPSHLVEIPHAALAVAESHTATDQRSRSCHCIDAEGNLSGADRCGRFVFRQVRNRFCAGAGALLILRGSR